MKNFIDDLSESFDYLSSAFTKVKPQIALFLSTIWTCISYVLFPDKTYITAACAVGGVMILDIITKYYALKKPYGSFLKAIKAGAIKSDTFFEGTKKKLISFLVLMILCGLSVRVVPVAGVAVFLGSLVYSVMFLRECQSCIENLVNAGHEDYVGWLLPILRRKEKDILKKEGADSDSTDDSDKDINNNQSTI